MSEKTGLVVSDVGEFGLIERLRQTLPPETAAGSNLRIGIGDDAAVWRPVPGRDLVITTDSLVEQIHFRLDWTDWLSLGHKSLAVNLSDLAAMGATPQLAVITLGLRGDERVGDLEDLYQGLGALAKRTGMLIVGGDIVRSPAALMINVAAIGDCAEGQVLSRSGAGPGDLIAVSGTLGASAAGLRLLADGHHESDARPASAGHLIAAHLRPEPRLRLGQALLAAGASAAMDLSDGLFGDLPKILEASHVSGEVKLDSIPVAASVRALFADTWLELATSGGEDYELLFTAPPERFTAIEARAAELGSTVTAIGHVTKAVPSRSRLVVRRPDGRSTAVPTGAYDHFRPALTSP